MKITARQYWYLFSVSTLILTTVYAQVVEKTSLVSPPDSSADLPLTVMLRWSSTAGASSYQVQVSTLPTFASTIVDRSGINGTEYEVDALERERTYYWRVRGSFLTVTGAWSDMQRFSTIPNPPTPPVLTSPAHASIDREISLVLSWNASQKATSYRLQVSNDSGFAGLIRDTTVGMSTSFSLANLQRETTYFWKVHASNAGGTSAWSAINKFTTIPNPPPAPALHSPVNSAINQPLAVQLSWRPAEKSSSYHMQVSHRADFSAVIVNDSSVSDTTQQIASLLNDTTYYWRVAAANNGGKSVWSAGWSFTTIPQQPAVPTLASPIDNAFVDTNAVLFSWNSVPKTSRYWLQVSQDSSFGSTVISDSTIVSTSYSVTDLKYNDRYFWRIRALNAGGTSSWTKAFAFITRSRDSYTGPQLVSPANGSVDQPHTVSLEWNPVPLVLAYHIQVSLNENFTPVAHENVSVVNTSYQVPSLSGNTKYYWRVRSLFSLFSSEWSETWNFTTIPNSPAVPLLVTPLNNTTDIPTIVRFAWRPTPSANRYHLQVSNGESFSSFIVNDGSVTDTVCQIESLAKDTKYYWRVAAINNGGKSDWSAVWSFTTLKAVLPPPQPLFPPGGLKLDSNFVTISWNAAQQTLYYWLQLATDSQFINIVLNDSMISKTSRTITGLLGTTTYYWRVRSNQPQSQSQWSEPRSFTTGSPSTSAGPSLVSPADNSTNQPTTVTLSWDSDAGVSSYHVQLSKRVDFASTVFDRSSVTGTSVEVSALENGTNYFWRVRTHYLLVSSDWSSTWKFTTTPKKPAVPALIAPVNGTTNQPLVVTFQWSPSVDTSKYHLQVAGDSLFTALKENDSTLLVSSKEIRSLAVNTPYYWRVRSGMNGMWSGFTPYWTFKTKPGDIPTASTQSASNITATSAMLTAVVSANGYETTVRFQYGTTPSYGNSVDGIPLTIEDTATSRVITNTLYGLAPNTTYHYRVSTTNQLGSTEGENRSFTTTLPSYPSSFSINTTIPFPSYPAPSDYKQTEYRIVGLPGNSNISVDSLMLGIPRTNWEMYWDNGDSGRILVPFDGSANFTFSTGRAFWLIKKGPLTIQRTASTAPLDSANEVHVPLHPGWNLITNPFDTAIAWSKLQSVNNTTQALYSFDGSFSISQTMKPYSGYYFFNDLEEKFLRVPYDAIFESPAPVPDPVMLRKSSDMKWKITIALLSDEIADASTWFGAVAGSPEQRRIHKPAGFEMLPVVYFDRPEWNNKHHTFATDFRNAFEHHQSWNFTVWNPTRQASQLKLTGIHSVPDKFEVYLIDHAGGRSVNLRSDSIYRFLPAVEEAMLTIVVGTADSIRQMLKSVATPKSFALGNNYPNPFNPETSIPVSIPYRSTIELTIYNILGQKIRTLYNGDLDAGNHWFRWDGTQHDGAHSPSGVYFSHLKGVGNISIVKKMLLTR